MNGQRFVRLRGHANRTIDENDPCTVSRPFQMSDLALVGVAVAVVIIGSYNNIRTCTITDVIVPHSPGGPATALTKGHAQHFRACRSLRLWQDTALLTGQYNRSTALLLTWQLVNGMSVPTATSMAPNKGTIDIGEKVCSYGVAVTR